MAKALEDTDIGLIERGADLAIRFERSGRRVRAVLNGTTIADSTHAMLMLEKKRLPVYYFPETDVRRELLVPTSRLEHHAGHGQAQYWTLKLGSREAAEAAWSYPDPEFAQLKGYVAFYWNKMDQWYEEDDEVFAHPRDPYHRVDVLQSSRRVKVVLGGEVVAETDQPRLLFETNLPTRYYIPKLDVRMDLLTPTDLHTRCPYKGEASYWTVTVGGQEFENIVWAYPAPIPEIPKLENLLCFYNEKVDAIYVDGELQTKPKTPWS